MEGALDLVGVGGLGGAKDGMVLGDDVSAKWFGVGLGGFFLKLAEEAVAIEEAAGGFDVEPEGSAVADGSFVAVENAGELVGDPGKVAKHDVDALAGALGPFVARLDRKSVV